MEAHKFIEGYNRKYSITQFGNIYSTKRGRIKRLKPQINKYGYYKIGLYNDNKKYKTYTVHRLVAIYWIQNPENKPEVNHIDCDKSNNYIGNIEWATSSENSIHALMNGLYTRNHYKLGIEKVREIKYLISIGLRNQDLAETYNVDPSTISKIRSGQRWGNL